MSFVSVFNHPVKGVFRSLSHQSTLKAEERYARSLDKTAEFGDYLYTRLVRQVPMRTGQRYAIRIPNSASRFHYRHVDEAIEAQFDYYSINNDGKLVLLLDHEVEIPGLNVRSTAQLKACFNSAKAFKFTDFCKNHYVAVEIAEGKLYLRGYKSEWSPEPASEAIELQLLQ